MRIYSAALPCQLIVRHSRQCRCFICHVNKAICEPLISCKPPWSHEGTSENWRGRDQWKEWESLILHIWPQIISQDLWSALLPAAHLLAPLSRDKRSQDTVLSHQELSEISIKTLGRRMALRREAGLWILQGREHAWSTLWHSCLFFRFLLEHEVGDQANHCIPHFPECFWVPPPQETRKTYLPVPKCSCFLKRGGKKINGYLQFVDTQSILCGSYPLNGDEGTIQEYGHFRVTADLGRWPQVEVFVLDPERCVGYWFLFILCLFKSVGNFTQRGGKSPLHGCLTPRLSRWSEETSTCCTFCFFVNIACTCINTYSVTFRDCLRFWRGQPERIMYYNCGHLITCNSPSHVIAHSILCLRDVNTWTGISVRRTENRLKNKE